MLRHLVASVAVAGAALFGAATAAQAAPQTPLERTINAGWNCELVINGNPHCFDPGDGKSNNAKSTNVKVYTPEGEFLGTEQIWRNAPQTREFNCPQDVLLYLGPGVVACHHYAQ